LKLQLVFFASVACLVAAASAQTPTTAPSSDQQANLNPPPGPDAGPTTAPTAEIAGLIAQLGDGDFHVRQRAAERLKEIGKPALPALRAALSAADPEIQMRAQELIDAITHPPLPGTGSDGSHLRRTVRVTIINGAQTIDATEGDRTVHIEQDADGIRMRVAGKVKGKEASQEFKAANADDLKKNHPDAYALYQHYAALHNHLSAERIEIRLAPQPLNPKPVQP
jgi:hypothetical protein